MTENLRLESGKELAGILECSGGRSEFSRDAVERYMPSDRRSVSGQEHLALAEEKPFEIQPPPSILPKGTDHAHDELDVRFAALRPDEIVVRLRRHAEETAEPAFVEAGNLPELLGPRDDAVTVP